MKILVVSHNVFSETASMGKTLMSYFRGVSADDLAQLYVHSEVPTTDFCTNYYRMTDKEIIKSILTRRSGRVLTEADVCRDRITARTDTGHTAKLYQKARKRTPLVYLARNTWWALGKWKTRKLLDWVDGFAPDIVFLASGDYAFTYRIARTLAKHRGLPLVVSCMDDYYFFNKNEGKLLGKWVHRRLMKEVRRTMVYASCIYAICDKMSLDYAELFGIPTHTMATPSTISEPLPGARGNSISYIGGLGGDRHLQLVRLGQALHRIECEGKPSCIDVYSPESRPEVLAHLTEENGIRFHGKISAGEVLEVMSRSMALIHTESFDPQIRRRVAYSVSTKIADSLASGTCILAYGPGEIASIRYLSDNGAAYCITDGDDVEQCLQDFLAHPERRQACVERALRLARENHDQARNGRMLLSTMEEICRR